ncbi:MAG: M23 family metallopeptidase [Granulosicoccus sp.]
MGKSLSQIGTGIGEGVKSGFSKVTAFKPGTPSAKNIGDAAEIAAMFPLDQMPHTMMNKPVAEGRLSSGFGYRINPKGIRIPKRHKGIDYAAPRGTAIYAAESGVVDKIYVSKSYGNYIRIAHENDFFTAYAHMNAFADGLEEGTKVARGQIIGQVGNTGKSSGPHLHFELIHAGKFIDPLFEIEPATVAASE